MFSKIKALSLYSLLLITLFGCQKDSQTIQIEDMVPWCIVAFDSLERTPENRIKMIKDFGFTMYAYDWRDHHLTDSKKELILAQENDIDILSVWIWMNPKRDSIHKLSPANEKMFKIVKELNLKTTFWVGLSPAYFKKTTHKQALELGTNLIQHVAEKADSINCKVALYNHKGWFGNPLNQIEIIKGLPEHDLSLVYNFHHGHQDIDTFSELAPKMKRYLSAVNLNGMEKDGQKILTIGQGDYETEMINALKEVGFNGPWGILGHVGEKDVEMVLKKNIKGLKSIQ